MWGLGFLGMMVLGCFGDVGFGVFGFGFGFGGFWDDGFGMFWGCGVLDFWVFGLGVWVFGFWGLEVKRLRYGWICCDHLREVIYYGFDGLWNIFT